MRQRLRLWLFLCLLPALLILLIFAGLSGYVVHGRVQADRFVGSVVEEISTVKICMRRSQGQKRSWNRVMEQLQPTLQQMA
ncbi:MAG: hypothetical protein R2867_39710 [Caldilineaceae bacterium]